MKKFLAILLSLGILIGTVSLTAFTANLTPEITIEEFTEQLSEMNKEYKDEPVSNRLIVKSKHDIPILDGVAIVEGYNDLHIVQFDNGESARKALEYYNYNKLIEFAEQDSMASILDVKTSPTINNFDKHLSWGSEEIGIDDYVDYLGDTTDLPEIVVGIIDTGIEINHEFLSDRIIQTGYNSSYSGETNSENDDNGHGTHVAGIVVDNTTDNVKLKGYKVLDNNGSGVLSSIILAIDKAVEDDVNVINMSLGTYGESKLMTSTVNKAIQEGLTVCVSAGNSGDDALKYTPAGIESCITVAAIGQNDARPFWTNYGSGVDIIAPGMAINSSYLNNSYNILSGTSMACPFVAAASAMILSNNPSYNYDEVLSIIEENGRSFNDNIYNKDGRFNGKLVLYIGDITASELNRTPSPNFSVESGKYSDSIEVKITCDEDADIFYTLDGSRATLTNGILYSEPIVIDSVTRIHAIAKAPNKLKSLQATADYYITTTDPEGNFEIDTNGTIVAYNGSNNYLTIPDKINGITVKAIGSQVFSTSSVSTTITMIKAPNTLESVGAQAFYGCSALYSFDCQSLKEVKEYGFADCSKLEEIDLTQLETAERYAFWNCKSLQELSNEHITTVEKYTFNGLNSAISIYLPNVTRVEYGGLQNALSAQEIIIPKVEYLGRSALFWCRAVQRLDLPLLKETDSSGYQFLGTSSLKELSLPSLIGAFPKMAVASSGISKIIIPKAEQLDETALKSANHLELVYIPGVTTIQKNAFNNANDYTVFMPSVTVVKYNRIKKATLYTMGSTTELSGLNVENCNIIAPIGSDAESWANENGYTFTDSDTMVDAIGTHTDENGNTVFEFGWNNVDDIEQYANIITYGADDSYNANVIEQSGGNTYFSVLSGNESVCGCVNIDGMVFRSRVLSIGENDLEPEGGCEHDWQIIYSVSVPNDTIVVFRCDECASYYRISFMEHINTDYPLLDMNNDNIVNAKDLACIIKEYQRS